MPFGNEILNIRGASTKLKLWQKSKTKIVTNSNCYKTQIVTKVKQTKCKKKKIKFWQTQIVVTSNCDKNEVVTKLKEIKLWPNFKTYSDKSQNL